MNNNPITSREKVLRTIKSLRTCSIDKHDSCLENRPLNSIPRGEICIDDEVVRREMQRDKVGFEERREFIKKLGHDIVCLAPEAPSYKYRLPDVSEVVLKDLKLWVDKSGLFTFALLDGAIGWGIKLFGFEYFVTLPYKSPLTFSNFIKQVEDLNRGLINIFTDEGIDGILVADDLAYTKSLIFRPETLRKYIIPSLSFQVGEIHACGAVPFFHSDGNTREILDDIYKIGFLGIHCIDKNCNMDIGDLVSIYGDKLCFWGSLDMKDLDNSMEEIYLNKLVQDIAELSGKSRFILGTTSGIFDGLNLEGLKRIYRGIDAENPY